MIFKLLHLLKDEHFTAVEGDFFCSFLFFISFCQKSFKDTILDCCFWGLNSIVLFFVCVCF